MTQTERNIRSRQKTGKVSKTMTIYANDFALHEQNSFTHAEIYAAGIKYLIELKGESQHSENIS